jgi:DNA-binding PadR family transcriptional regulator
MADNKDQGPLTETVFYVLLALHERTHGYLIMQRVAEMSGGRVKLGPGTLYGALTVLVDKGWIEPVDGTAGDRKKEYVITDLGRGIVRGEITRLNELLSNGRRVTKEDAA